MAGVVDFTNEEEVKEYLNNIEIEYMYGCNKVRDENSCYRLAEFMETIRKKFREAAKVYKDCCSSFHSAPCCYKLGQFHMLGRGGLAKSKDEAYESYNMACEQENYTDQGKNDRIAAACCNKALLLSSEENIQERFLNSIGKSDSQNRNDLIFSEMVQAYERSCGLRDPSGCGFLGQLYLSGFKEAHKNLELAAKYAQLACEYGEVRSCHNLAIMYKRGEGVVKDLDKSAEYAKRRDELIHGNMPLDLSKS